MGAEAVKLGHKFQSLHLNCVLLFFFFFYSCFKKTWWHNPNPKFCDEHMGAASHLGCLLETVRAVDASPNYKSSWIIFFPLPVFSFFNHEIVPSHLIPFTLLFFPPLEHLTGWLLWWGLVNGGEKNPLLIDLRAFVWCSKQCNLICRRSAVIQTLSAFHRAFQPEAFH